MERKRGREEVRKMKIMVGSDHAGYCLKLKVIERLNARPDIEVTDIGSDSDAPVKYPPFASIVADAVTSGEADRGVLICSTGIGMSIVANRYKGVRATLCTSTFMGRMSRLHNDSNVLCLGGRITGYMEALDILDVWLDTGFEGGRHDISLGMLRSIDAGEPIVGAAPNKP